MHSRVGNCYVCVRLYAAAVCVGNRCAALVGFADDYQSNPGAYRSGSMNR